MSLTSLTGIGPTVEAIAAIKGIGRVGIFATTAAVNSKTYLKEFKKINPKIKVFQQAAPQLVPLIEANQFGQIPKILAGYLRPLKDNKSQAVILGSTHYCLIKAQAKKILGKNIKIIDQSNRYFKLIYNVLYNLQDNF